MDKIIVQPLGGLCNRMRVIVGAISLAQKTGKQLTIIWTQDATLNSKFSDKSIFQQKENVILVVSRMYEWHKRISVCLKAWKELHQKPTMQTWRMVIVGTGEDLPMYKQYVEKHNVKRVSFEGQQSPEQYYNKAKIFLMTSEREGWGLTITEAMQRGVVPVAFDTSSAFHDIITDGGDGYLVKEGARKDFVKKIELLAKDDELWQAMAKNALFYANRFSLDKITKLWESVIN